MSRKIFNSIWFSALSAFLISLILIMIFTYGYFSDVQKKRLKTETQLAAQGVNLSGIKFFDGLESGNCRITWIDADGNVLYDNEADSGTMENHLEREEIKMAKEQGFGEAERYSKTLSEKLFYAAQLLPDGTVIRLSNVQSTLWVLLLGFARPIALVILLVLALSLLLASRISQKVVEPINMIDPEKPAAYLGRQELAEVEPLLRNMVRQQLEIKKTQAELEKTAQIRQEFTANASHELKTPLHAISGYAELLENGMVREEDIRPFAGKIRKEAQRMTKLVSDIIDLTKLDSGSGNMQRQNTNLFLIARNAIDSLQQEADSSWITLSLSGGSAVVFGISPVLYSIVYNLCDNAIKYNRPGGSVDAAVRNVEGGTELCVRDTGIGIPAEEQERIFERFYRVDKSHSGEIGGTGLGLSIVKHGVMLHNGKIKVSSEPGLGTEIRVLFPEPVNEHT